MRDLKGFGLSTGINRSEVTIHEPHLDRCRDVIAAKRKK